MFKHLRRSIEKRLVRLAACYPHNYSEPQDIFITGYPKSGNTWMQHIVSAMVFGVDPGLCPDSLVQELVVDIYDRQHYYRRLQSTCYFKSHELPHPRYRRVIYLIRDGRDVMVSYRHFLQLQNGKPVDFAAMVRDGRGLFVGKWHDHVRQWRQNPFGAELLVVKYESLQQEPLDTLRRICAFIKIQRADEQLRRVIEQTGFQRMQQREIEQGWSKHKDWRDSGKLFTRRGKTGSHQDELPPALREEFERQARDELLENGYEIKA